MFEKINNDLITAMKSKDKDTLTVLRSIKGAMQLEKINNQKELTDEVIVGVIDKQIKMRKDSITEFEKGNRNDLIEAYQKEIDILKQYMPAPLTDKEVNELIDTLFLKLKPEGMSGFGLMMKEITPLVKGKYDVSKVSIIIKEKLNK